MVTVPLANAAVATNERATSTLCSMPAMRVSASAAAMDATAPSRVGACTTTLASFGKVLAV